MTFSRRHFLTGNAKFGSVICCHQDSKTNNLVVSTDFPTKFGTVI